MAVLTQREEILCFFNDEAWWPENTESHICIDDEVILCGENFDTEAEFDATFLQKLPEAAKIKIVCGSVYDEIGNFSDSLVAYFKRWRKAQTTVNFAVECDKSVEEAVRSAIKVAGGKVR